MDCRGHASPFPMGRSKTEPSRQLGRWVSTLPLCVPSWRTSPGCVTFYSFPKNKCSEWALCHQASGTATFTHPLREPVPSPSPCLLCLRHASGTTPWEALPAGHSALHCCQGWCPTFASCEGQLSFWGGG